MKLNPYFSRCRRCDRLAGTKLGSWRFDGYQKMHRWVAGGRSECGLTSQAVRLRRLRVEGKIESVT